MSATARLLAETIAVPMPDGAMLNTEVVVADDGERHPVLLMRTPYGAGAARAVLDPVGLAMAGWAVVLQDTRGRFASTGEFDPFSQEIADGPPAVAWCARQPWSNGKVAMMGGSYLGLTQWFAAVGGSPALRAISPGAISPDLREHWTHEGGALNLGLMATWVLAVAGVGTRRSPAAARKVLALSKRWEQIIREPVTDGTLVDLLPEIAPYLVASSPQRRRGEQARTLRNVDIPVFHTVGWYDLFTEGAIAAYENMVANAPSEYARNSQRLIVGPWTHAHFYGQTNGYVDWTVEANALYKGFLAEQSSFLLAALDRQEVRSGVSVFVLGRNRWLDRDSWPFPATDRSLFLASTTGANGLAGDGRLLDASAESASADRYMHDPGDPVPTMGGRTMNAALPGPGPMDQRSVESRSDVLVYTGDRLNRDVTVIGTVRAELYFASSAPRADVCVKLVDVAPDGESINIVDSVRRIERADGRARKIEVTIGTTAALFKRGHRIRVEIASSNFPHFDVLEKADQTLRHGGHTPSRVILPIFE